MCFRLTPQQRMDSAFDNYLTLSRVLQDDMNALIAAKDDTPHWRRNFVRTASALVEGFGHCFRDMCSVSFEVEAPHISVKEQKAIGSEGSFSTPERIKYTLRSAYKLFQLDPAPDFGCVAWEHAKVALARRDLLMHPRKLDDVVITDAEWQKCHDGLIWLLEHLFAFIELLHKKHSA